MPTKINLLLKKKEQPKEIKKAKSFLIRGTLVLMLLLVVASAGIYGYVVYLTQISTKLAAMIVDLDSQIAQYQDIEEKKSILTIKTGELRKLYGKRFDYLTALSDLDILFGHSIAIDSVAISESGVVQMSAKKIAEVITFAEEQAFSTKIQEINLKLEVGNSSEFQETVDNLKSFQGKGLSEASVLSSELTETGTFNIVFHLVLAKTGESGAQSL
ncbi:hypothetical protein HY468_04740 [Candidatus Roizmanbacteria bacterium]|nr:hypothetical protein [Candidatus Roizmanbacteria bacterium]